MPKNGAPTVSPMPVYTVLLPATAVSKVPTVLQKQPHPANVWALCGIAAQADIGVVVGLFVR